jgi:hypothetical protein
MGQGPKADRMCSQLPTQPHSALTPILLLWSSLLLNGLNPKLIYLHEDAVTTRPEHKQGCIKQVSIRG